MWTSSYSEEVKSYFVDNEPYAFELLIRLEELKYLPEAMPLEGLTVLDEPNTYLWEVLGHLVYLKRFEALQSVHILAVKSLD